MHEIHQKHFELVTNYLEFLTLHELNMNLMKYQLKSENLRTQSSK